MPTIRQKKAYKKVVENGGNVSKGMIEANYSPKTAKTPQKLTKSKGWLELLEKDAPDKDFTKTLKEGLKANRVISANITYGEADEKTNDFIEVPDFAVRHKYLETGLKLKSKFPKEDPTPPSVQINLIQVLERVNSIIDGNIRTIRKS